MKKSISLSSYLVKVDGKKQSKYTSGLTALSNVPVFHAKCMYVKGTVLYVYSMRICL